MRLDDILARVQGLDDPEREELKKAALDATADMVWVPNPGPQTDAFFSDADELFYGGQAGGGKTDLSVGLALTAHRRSLILRRYSNDVDSVAERAKEILKGGFNWNGQKHSLKYDGRQIDFGGCKEEKEKQRYKGDPHDLICFDEGSDFLESMYRFIIGWNRTTTTGQRCRVVVTSNPPTNPEGYWVIKYWGPWLDPNHKNPAKPGELRWFTTINDVDTEVDGPGPHMVNGEPIMARSRTYIPSTLADNPDLASTNYASVLAAMPKELRDAYKDGDFSSAIKDAKFQLIPTEWVIAAQERWNQEGFRGLQMSAMGYDAAGGGSDPAMLSRRYGGWYDELIEIEGKDSADGSKTAGMIVAHRRHSCPVVIDVGGGYAGSTIIRLKDNGVPYAAFDGAQASSGRTRDGTLGFFNKRAEAYWKFREELDPDQDGGSLIALPPDAQLRAELCAPTFEVRKSGIIIESKEDIRKRLGRSTNKADSVVMALSEGDKMAVKMRLATNRPKVLMSSRHSNRR